MKCEYLDCQSEIPEGRRFCSSDCMIAAEPPIQSAGHEMNDPDFLTPDQGRFLLKAMGRGPTKKDTLTSLDHFAMAAATGLLANGAKVVVLLKEERLVDAVSVMAYEIARAMMKERAK